MVFETATQETKAEGQKKDQSISRYPEPGQQEKDIKKKIKKIVYRKLTHHFVYICANKNCSATIFVTLNENFHDNLNTKENKRKNIVIILDQLIGDPRMELKRRFSYYQMDTEEKKQDARWEEILAKKEAIDLKF